MLKIIMIRHFATEGNLKKRYIGVTDEPLCEAGKQKLNEIEYPVVDVIYASPLKRCIETAELIYPHQTAIVLNGFMECNFGKFENKNYLELADNPDYQAWIDSNGTLPFSKGENPEDFKIRCINTFQKVVKESIERQDETIAFVVHGGTIMSILDQYSYPKEEYYHWQAKNGEGYTATLELLEEKEWRLSDICAIH